MAQINSIRKLFFEEGLGYAEIARSTGFDVKTIKKYVLMENFNEPGQKPAATRASKLDPYRVQIDAWLENDKKERRKQRHTAKRVYDRLVREHPKFDCSYRLVADYVSAKKKEIYGDGKGFFMPLIHEPGGGQVDFGQADFFDRNTRITGYYLNVSFPYSNGGYTQLFRGENFQCLGEGLRDIFEHIGGIPKKLWFDNLSPVVKTVMKNGERGLTDQFMRLVNHYGFSAAFCNPGKGNEKGSVENKVGYHRRNFLVPVPRVDNLRAFNHHLLTLGDEDMLRPHYKKERLLRDLFEEDKEAFLPLPAIPFDESEIVAVRTDNYAKFTLAKGKHTYSTAPKYAKGRIFAKLTAHEVTALDDNYREIVRHSRLYGDSRQETMDWLPYLSQLAKRPAALKYTGIYTMLPQEVRGFLDSCAHPVRKETLKALADLTRRKDFDKATRAVKAIVSLGAKDVDSIIAAFNRLNGGLIELEPIALPTNIPNLPKLKSGLGNYDHVFLTGVQSDEN